MVPILTSNPDESLMGRTQNLECYKSKVKCQVYFNGGIFLIWTEVLEKIRDLVACTMIKYYNYEKV